MTKTAQKIKHGQADNFNTHVPLYQAITLSYIRLRCSLLAPKNQDER